MYVIYQIRSLNVTHLLTSVIITYGRKTKNKLLLDLGFSWTIRKDLGMAMFVSPLRIFSYFVPTPVLVWQEWPKTKKSTTSNA